MNELNKTLDQLTLEQYLLALVFLLSYGAALGSMFGAAGRLRACLLALPAAAGFVALTQPWEHGVLLVLCAIGGIGLFIASSYAFSALTVSKRWSSSPQTATHPARSPALRDVAGLAVAQAARAVKRLRHHST